MITVSLKERIEEFTVNEINEAVKVFNAIWDWVSSGGYRQGWRNTIAVDFSIACHILGLIPSDLVYQDWDIQDDDFYHPYERFENVENYLNHWYPIIDYAIDWNYWLERAEKSTGEYLKLAD